jgi:hypothetical protein
MDRYHLLYIERPLFDIFPNAEKDMYWEGEDKEE